MLCSVDSALVTACCSMWADWVFSWSVGIQKRIIFCQSLFVCEMLSKCRVNVQIALKFSNLSIFFFYNSRDFLKFFLVSKIPPKILELCSFKPRNCGLKNRRQKNLLINTRLVFCFFPFFLLLFRLLFCRLCFSADSDIYESFSESSRRSIKREFNLRKYIRPWALWPLQAYR